MAGTIGCAILKELAEKARNLYLQSVVEPPNATSTSKMHRTQ